ncbi:hypothetical protein [Halorubrum halodurans]|uniref:Uncharacterized protein n=1 Tax=Halorubrum halodurans TaxID=1383851 RepID=A0A256IQA9_9EURY|nr:hypothetical protein [Halorubrum halodurans]OYR58623.1 hypothetical protein DJ70_02535 [Halorubrum halodurans]
MSTAVPVAEKIANRLAVEAGRLQQFVEFHPDPGVDVVAQLGDVAPAELDAGDRQDIARWIDDVREKPDTGEMPGARVRFDGKKMGYQSDVWFDHHPEMEREPERADGD